MANVAKFDFYGSSELINRLEKAGKNVIDEIIKAVDESSKPVEDDLKSFMAGHRRTGTGATINSYFKEITTEGNVIKLRMGFDSKKGGVAAIFLNLGTPYIAPSFFIDNAVEENVDKIKRIQQETLANAFKGV
jgi:HK97 gp10 family phage protein